MEKFFLSLIIAINGLFSFISLLPIFKINRYYFEDSSTPNLETKFFSFIQISLLHSNPMVLIALIACFFNIFISINCIVKQNFRHRIWVKMLIMCYLS